MGKIINFDFNNSSLRTINSFLQNVKDIKKQNMFSIINPNGQHAICAGLNSAIEININGHVGYYCGGMNQKAKIIVNGHAGTGLGENMMSGLIHVKGSVSQSAGATAHGGSIIIDGDAGSRCGISMKGVDIIVKGSVGHMAGFMAQKGSLLICGDAGEALGDSIYETVIYIAGDPQSLGADCIEKNILKNDQKKIQSLLIRGKIKNKKISDFKKFSSARKLYNFRIENVSNY